MLLPDDLIWNRGPGALKQMADVAAATGASVIAVQDVPRDRPAATASSPPRISATATAHQRDRREARSRTTRRARSPSSAATCSTPRIFALLEQHDARRRRRDPAHRRASPRCCRSSASLAYRFEGTRFDCGTHIGLIEATIRYALDHETSREAARVRCRGARELGVVRRAWQQAERPSRTPSGEQRQRSAPRASARPARPRTCR